MSEENKDETLNDSSLRSIIDDIAEVGMDWLSKRVDDGGDVFCLMLFMIVGMILALYIISPILALLWCLIKIVIGLAAGVLAYHWIQKLWVN